MVVSDKGIVDSVDISEVGITDGLVGWWPLNGTAKDLSGNANNGTVSGATVVSGLNGLCYSFDGVSNYIESLSDPLTSNYNNFTMTGWIKTTSAGGAVIVHRVNRADNTSVLQLRIYSGNVTVDYYYPSSGSLTGTKIINDNIFHMITLTHIGTTRSIYVDGVLDASQPSSEAYIGQTPNRIIFGADKRQTDQGDFYLGLLEDVRIYNRALTQEEVNILYELGNTANKVKQSKNTIYVKGEFNEML